MSGCNYGNANSNGNYYDPVGSQQNQPTGYTYGTSTSSAPNYPSAATTRYQNAPGSGTFQGHNSTYNNQQYGSNSGAGNSSYQAASSSNGLSGPGYNQQTAGTAIGSAGYDGSSWTTANYGTYHNNTSGDTNLASQAPSGTFGRLSAPDQTRSNSTYGAQNYQATTRQHNATQQSHHTAPTQPSQVQQPQRYNSPLHAAQAPQQTRNTQATRPAATTTHQPSPRLQNVQRTHTRQASGSAEPQSATTMTVNPSQVYDEHAERQRKARIEAEKRRKRDAELAARTAEEDRMAEEGRKEEEAKQNAETEAATKKAAGARQAEARSKAREEIRQSKSAATTLAKMAASGAAGSSAAAVASEEAPPLNSEEAEMRAMFKKMREFNAKNPAMLAKLWEEERTSHTASQSPQAAPNAPPNAPPSVPTVPTQQPKTPAMPNTGAPRATQTPKSTPASAKASKAAEKPEPRAAMPINAQASTSLWPPHKKGILSEAAAKWLSNLAENDAAGKKVAREDILKILDGNPSYVRLCEALEKFGLKFERSALARELLKAVPDSMKAQVQQQPSASAVQTAVAPLPTVNGVAAQTNTSPNTPRKKAGPKKNVEAPATVDYEAPSFTSLSVAARAVNSMGNTMPPGGPVQPPHYYPAPFATPQQHAPPPVRAPSVSQPPPEVKAEVRPQPPPRPPANKEEAARKRTFNDLVDLTAEDSDDEPPPKKIFFQPSPSAAESSQQLPQPPAPTAQMSTTFRRPMTAQDFYNPMHRSTPALGLGAAVPWGSAGVQVQPPRPPPPAEMVQQPHQPQPQQQPQHKHKGPPLESKQSERIRGRMLVEPVMRDRVARKNQYDNRTIARDVLLATGRHPDMRALNSHLHTMAKLLGDHGGSFEVDGQRGNRADLATIRWDIIDPLEPVKADARVPHDDAALDADDEGDDSEPDPEPEPRMIRQAVDNGDGTVSYTSVRDQPLMKPHIKRRGRPPKSSLPRTSTLPSTGTLTLTGGTAEPTSRAHTPRQTVNQPRQTPASVPAPGGTPVGYAAFRQVDENGNVIKKKGRPVGWRKAVHSREVNGLDPAKGSKPSKDTKPPKTVVEIEPKYQVWRCKWRGCKAELHNLETLKKHVIKVHGKPNQNRELECLWAGCVPDVEGKGKGKADDEGNVATFAALEPWLEHVNQKHLMPVAWELGDGPKGGTSETALPRL
ncbi:hypothetical protein BAUCODRAFT_298259 [Baudoinia panamericana UAMH 10762]|uniref:C2H2-type domain-containing protein n=1 Tax=Baudoinia panamericana (strain UAMH 10762) TaxID=717646 RepID=M2MZ36_BAUPA|nr:uncharacterized protein BAUCODRAFT_298259 [Baudoinia panamericana UAMH 10762]EMC91575.1 hypothetical protein BAUCODRAFT_298259 [Baudoinia panamericana UAMH 10762]